MRRVVVTGIGIVSCLGNSTDDVTESLREGRSGISLIDDYAEQGMRSHIACLLYTSPSPRDATLSRMPSSA